MTLVIDQSLDRAVARVIEGRDWRVETIAANGLSFETLTAGAGDQLALCLHGFPEHFISWRFQIPLLAARGYTVWAPNMRGYGRSSAPEGVGAYGLETLVEDVAGLIDAAAARGLRPSLLMAHDWGGVVAWAFILNKIRPVDRYVVVNLPHPQAARDNMLRGRQLLRSWYISFFQIPGVAERLLGLNKAQRIVDAILEDAANRENFPPEVMAVFRENALRPGGLTAMINYYRANYLELFRGAYWVGETRTQTPTLMIWGAEDRHISAKMTDGTDQYVSDLTLKMLPGVSHWAQQDAPQEANAALEAWLDR